MKRSLRHLLTRPSRIATMILLLILAAVPPVAFEASAQQGVRARNARVSAQITLNQKRMRIEQLVRKVGEAAGRTILLPDDVRGTVSIVAKRPVSIDEAWVVLESSLSLLGYSLLPAPEGLWRVTQVAESVGEAPFTPRREGISEAFVTTLIPLREANVEDVMPVLEPLSGSRVTLVPYPETNSVIASGSEVAIARLTTLADELDRVEQAALRIRVLRYRGVSDVEPMVESYLEAGDFRVRRVQVWSDERTNSLAVRGEPRGVDQVVAFIADIDQPPEGGGAIRILRVLNRDAEEVAELIRSLSDGTKGATSEAREVAGPLDGADYAIAVDGPTRSLVVRAAPETQVAIRRVLEILDSPPRLIAVDITVSELRLPEAWALATGFQLPFATGSNDENDLVGFVKNDVQSTDQTVPIGVIGAISRDSGVAIQQDVGGAPVSVPILQSGTIVGVDFEAVNEVLIQPSLIITAGDEHEIFVGNNVPIPVTESGGIDENATIAGVNVPQISRTINFDRQDIGTRVALQATAGEEGKIQLDLEIELSNIDLTRAGLAGDPAEVGPTYAQQSLVAKARLDHGETAILAINRKDKEVRANSGVPFLRDIPVLGRFFRTDGSQVDQIRLVIAVRARRVSNPSELVADTIRRRLAFERRAARESNLPRVDGPPYGVRVTTRRIEDDARSIADALAYDGHATRVHGWHSDADDYWDVYVTGLVSMVDAGVVARELAEDGWETDLVVFSRRR